MSVDDDDDYDNNKNNNNNRKTIFEAPSLPGCYDVLFGK